MTHTSKGDKYIDWLS